MDENVGLVVNSKKMPPSATVAIFVCITIAVILGITLGFILGFKRDNSELVLNNILAESLNSNSSYLRLSYLCNVFGPRFSGMFSAF